MLFLVYLSAKGNCEGDFEGGLWYGTRKNKKMGSKGRVGKLRKEVWNRISASPEEQWLVAFFFYLVIVLLVYINFELDKIKIIILTRFI